MNPSTNSAALPPLTGGKLVLATLAVALATFMNVLDSSIANVAIPTISGNLGVSIDEGTWVITLFAAANAIAIPLTGWLTQRVGQIKLFVWAILLFVLSSWLCGIAPTVADPARRANSAGGGGGSVDSAVAGHPARLVSEGKEFALRSAFVGDDGNRRPDRRSRARRVDHGQLLLVVDFLHQHSGGPFRGRGDMVHLPYPRNTNAQAAIDKVGLLSLIAWVASLQIMLDKGKDLDWFHSPVIIALTVFAAISFTFFVIWELTEKNPIVDIKLFKGRNFLGGTVAISVAYAVFFSNLVILPQWMQGYLNYRSVDAGLVTAPLGIFAVILAPVMAKIMPKSDARVLATLAFLGFAAVFFMRSRYTTDVDTYTLVLPTLLQGISDPRSSSCR